MVSLRQIITTINNSENGFYECWNIMSSIKEGTSTAEQILSFQTKLIDCLVPIEQLYSKVAHEKSEVISRIRELKSDCFKRRLRTLSKYRNILVELISFGRSFGDAFVWLFYSREKQLLIKHLKITKPKHLPPGVGGIGEFEFIKKIKIFRNNMVIYHGITNMLRFGDVSFINLENLKVIAIGELKTRKISNKEIEVSVYFTGEKDAVEDTFSLSKRLSMRKIDLPDRLKQKLIRQLKETSNSIYKTTSNQLNGLDLGLHNYFKELADLAKNCKTSKFNYKKAGEGLLLAGIRARKTKFHSKFIGKGNYFFLDELYNLPNEVKKITKEQSDENIIKLSTIHPHREVMPGALPLFWWPIDIDIIRKIYFNELLIFTIYNLVYFMEKLRSIGLNVKWNENKKDIIITKKINKRESRIQNTGYFIRMIQDYLVSEDSVVELIKKFLSSLEKKKFKAGTKIQMQILHEVRSDSNLQNKI